MGTLYKLKLEKNVAKNVTWFSESKGIEVMIAKYT